MSRKGTFRWSGLSNFVGKAFFTKRFIKSFFIALLFMIELQRRYVAIDVSATARSNGGQKESGTTRIAISDVTKKNATYYQKEKVRHLFCKRTNIEPILGILKSGQL